MRRLFPIIIVSKLKFGASFDTAPTLGPDESLNLRSGADDSSTSLGSFKDLSDPQCGAVSNDALISSSRLR